MKKFTCIICPLSCDIELEDSDGNIKISGNSCVRGEVYVKDEYKNPKRMITTTIVIENAYISRLPVISSAPIEKSLFPKALEIIYKKKITAPVKMGEIIIKNILDSGIDILASRDAPFLQSKDIKKNQ